MKNQEIQKLINLLSKDYFLFAPQEKEGGVFIDEIKKIDDINWSGVMPVNSWKSVFLPAHERLFDIEKGRLVEVKNEYPKIACVGINIIDLRALTLFEQVFSDDSYYQKRRRNMLMIGYSEGLPDDYKKFKIFSHKYQEDVLEHLVFDIFIIKQKSGKIRFYSGSEKGQIVLENFGIKNYEHIEFAGPISEKGPDKRMLNIMEKMEKSVDKKIWDELGKRCIACGKCSIACPTCFCFDFEDRSDPDDQSRSRKWGVCFYNDFSKVAVTGNLIL